MDIHEKYEFAQIVSGQTISLSFFNVVENNGKYLTIESSYMDIRLVLPKSQLKDYMRVLEKTWFDGMDADSWYGFELTLDRDD